MFFGRKVKEKTGNTESNGVALGVTPQPSNPAPLAGPQTSATRSEPSVSNEIAALQRLAAVRHASTTFGEIVTLLMRSQEYKAFPLGELEALVVPPLVKGQVSVATAQSKTNGMALPVGAILWARVSPDVSRRLTAEVGKPVRLAPEDWQSGDIIWVVASAGEGRVLSEMLKELSRRDWAGKEVRLVVRPKDGQPTVATLALESSQAA
jgi:hemolysin-activating ACP:hemolysin acyltransferase